MDLGSTCERRRIVLSTPRLTLTSWAPQDIDPLHEVHSDPETMRFVRHGRPESRTEVRALVEQYSREDLARGWTKWRLADHDGRLVGRAGFGGTTDQRSLSYLVRRELCGRGLAREIAAALVTWHLRNAAGSELRAVVAVGNDASARILQKSGFCELGHEVYAGVPCRSFVHPASLGAA